MLMRLSLIVLKRGIFVLLFLVKMRWVYWLTCRRLDSPVISPGPDAIETAYIDAYLKGIYLYYSTLYIAQITTTLKS